MTLNFDREPMQIQELPEMRTQGMRIRSLCFDHLGNVFRNREQCARHYGMSPFTVECRRNLLGWSLERALSTPPYGGSDV